MLQMRSTTRCHARLVIVCLRVVSFQNLSAVHYSYVSCLCTNRRSVRKGRMLCHTCAQRPHGWRKFLKTPKASPTPTFVLFIIHRHSFHVIDCVCCVCVLLLLFRPSSPDTVRRTDDGKINDDVVSVVQTDLLMNNRIEIGNCFE